MQEGKNMAPVPLITDVHVLKELESRLMHDRLEIIYAVLEQIRRFERESGNFVDRKTYLELLLYAAILGHVGVYIVPEPIPGEPKTKGACYAWEEDGKILYSHISLKENTKYNPAAQRQVAGHEFGHAIENGIPYHYEGDDPILKKITESFADCIGYHLLATSGVKERCFSAYIFDLVQVLPILNRYFKEFSACKTMEEFGGVCLGIMCSPEFRENGWEEIYTRCKSYGLGSSDGGLLQESLCYIKNREAYLEKEVEQILGMSREKFEATFGQKTWISYVKNYGLELFAYERYGLELPQINT